MHIVAVIDTTCRVTHYYNSHVVVVTIAIFDLVFVQFIFIGKREPKHELLVVINTMGTQTSPFHGSTNCRNQQNENTNSLRVVSTTCMGNGNLMNRMFGKFVVCLQD
jgi:hypothetical protein